MVITRATVAVRYWMSCWILNNWISHFHHHSLYNRQIREYFPISTSDLWNCLIFDLIFREPLQVIRGEQ